MPPLLPSDTWELNGVFVRETAVIVSAVAVGLLLLVVAVFRWTRIGLAFRVTSWAPELAPAYGVAVGAVQTGSVVASAVAMGLAGVLSGLLFGSVSAFAGATTGLKGVIAMLMGGAGNVYGALVGGLVVGISESVAELYISSGMKSVVSLALLLVVMVVRPQGLLQER
jgi:branched-chain amino acid transport system permease protein